MGVVSSISGNDWKEYWVPGDLKNGNKTGFQGIAWSGLLCSETKINHKIQKVKLFG